MIAAGGFYYCATRDNEGGAHIMPLAAYVALVLHAQYKVAGVIFKERVKLFSRFYLYALMSAFPFLYELLVKT